MPKTRLAVTAVIALLAGMPSLAHAEAGEGLLQRLYRLFHPDTAYQGSLTEVVQRSTLRSISRGALSRVLIVHRQTGESIEWVAGRGAVEPLVCPDGRTLIVRRGAGIERAYVRIDNGRAEAPGAATTLSGVRARQIFGCTKAAGSGWDLWLENAKGELQSLRLNGEAATPGGVPEAFRSDPPYEVGPSLRRLQGVRADGLAAMVRNSMLVIDSSHDGATQTVPLGMPVTGDAAWLGDSDWIVVTGQKN
jgi:hypothetical protein